MTGANPMFIACAARQAAIEVSRSASRARPPVMEVNAAVKPGSQLITSRITSGRSTRGSIAWTRLRRSKREGGSGMAFSAATCSRQSRSTLTSVPAVIRPAASR
jgi:hypothetical protein